jgi:hypothetical protein
MRDPRIDTLVRQFSENGLKLLLEHPKSVHELLRITGSTLMELIDFDHLTLDRTTFVQRDYRHVEADLVLHAPLLRPKGGRSRQTILIYILSEHQSEPDPLMTLRALDYVAQILKKQVRHWSQHHGSFAGIRLQPVLPVVFYTGTRHWDRLERIVDLMEMGQRFASVTPDIQPLFINLMMTPAQKLETAGGYLGWVLRLVQQRHARPEEFQSLLTQVVQHLETMPAAERLRWLELLSYVHALVYHERDPSERPNLHETIETSVRTDKHRQEVLEMRRTIADVLKEEGRKEGREEGREEGKLLECRKILLRQLHQSFSKVPKTIVAAIERSDDLEQLHAWLDRIGDAATLEEIGIGSANR